MTIEDMQLAAADLHARCTPREGYVTTEASLFLNAEDIAALDAIARFLALAAPFRDQIAAIISGKRGRG
jgi:hypothetical protein